MNLFVVDFNIFGAIDITLFDLVMFHYFENTIFVIPILVVFILFELLVWVFILPLSIIL